MKVPVSSRAGRDTGICREIRQQKYSCESNNWHTRLDTEVNHPTARWQTSSKGQKSLNRNRNRRSTFKRRLSKDVACSLVAGSHWGKQAGFQRRGCPLTPVNVSSAGAWRGQSQKRHAGHQAPPRGSDSKKALASYHRAAGPTRPSGPSPLPTAPAPSQGSPDQGFSGRARPNPALPAGRSDPHPWPGGRQLPSRRRFLPVARETTGRREPNLPRRGERGAEARARRPSAGPAEVTWRLRRPGAVVEAVVAGLAGQLGRWQVLWSWGVVFNFSACWRKSEN